VLERACGSELRGLPAEPEAAGGHIEDEASQRESSGASHHSYEAHARCALVIAWILRATPDHCNVLIVPKCWCAHCHLLLCRSSLGCPSVSDIRLDIGMLSCSFCSDATTPINLLHTDP